jgi:uncharacterized membrane protein
MNSAHLHLILNHIPVIGIWFAVIFFLIAVLRKDQELKRLSLLAIIVIALITIPVYLTGQSAEGIVEHMRGVSEEMIEQHEKFGLISLIAMLAIGAVALAGLLIYRGAAKMPGWFIALALAASIIAGALVIWTSNLGGQIHHPEARPGFTPAQGTTEETSHMQRR